MKINFILPFYNVTGGVRVVYELANHLKLKGHEVNVLYPIVPSQAQKKWYRINYFKVIYQTLKRLLNKDVDWFDLKANLLKFPFLTPSLAPVSEKFVPDADITIATQRSTAYFVDQLSSSKGTKAYFIQHYEIWPLWKNTACWEETKKINNEQPSLGMTHVVPQDNMLFEYKKYVDKSFELPLHKIVTSDWEVRIMKELDVPIEGSISYGLNFDMFYPIESSSRKDGINIIALYRNARERGDRECIEAFRKLNASNNDIQFYMFGETKTKEIPDFVSFFENPSQDKIRELYNLADIMVYPSWVEGYGMPPMEAMACNTALITTDVGAVRDYVPENWVQFIPIQDSDAIVQEVELLKKQPNKIEKMKKEGLRKIKKFTWDNSVNEFEGILKKISRY